jgi:hypothetical protein
MKIHYLYLIEHTSHIKYLGIRGCLGDPKDDLGVVYFSSSSDLEFILDQKLNPQDYTYRVLHKHRNREIIAKLEVCYHNALDVGINENFYNKSKQTSAGFSTEGVTSWNKGVGHSQDTKDKMSEAWKTRSSITQVTRDRMSKAQTGKKRSKETRDKMSQAAKNRSVEYLQLQVISHTGKKLSEKTKSKISKSLTGKKLSQETKDKISKSNQNISQERRDKISKAQKNMVTYRDLRTGKTGRIAKEEFDKDPLLVGISSKKPNLNKGIK